MYQTQLPNKYWPVPNLVPCMLPFVTTQRDDCLYSRLSFSYTFILGVVIHVFHWLNDFRFSYGERMVADFWHLKLFRYFEGEKNEITRQRAIRRNNEITRIFHFSLIRSFYISQRNNDKYRLFAPEKNEKTKKYQSSLFRLFVISEARKVRREGNFKF